MGLSRLSEKCKKCPFIEKCKKKQMAAEAIRPLSMDAAAPMIREKRIIYVNGKALEVYKDEIEKKLYEDLGVGLMKLGC